MNLSDCFVPESAIDYDAVMARGGANSGDEDFAFFKCPACKAVYLMEYEDDTVYLDGRDLSQRLGTAAIDQGFICTHCHRLIPNGIWIGPRAEERFQVTWRELQASAWAWAVTELNR